MLVVRMKLEAVEKTAAAEKSALQHQPVAHRLTGTGSVAWHPAYPESAAPGTSLRDGVEDVGCKAL